MAVQPDPYCRVYLTSSKSTIQLYLFSCDNTICNAHRGSVFPHPLTENYYQAKSANSRKKSNTVCLACDQVWPTVWAPGVEPHVSGVVANRERDRQCERAESGWEYMCNSFHTTTWEISNLLSVPISIRLIQAEIITELQHLVIGSYFNTYTNPLILNQTKNESRWAVKKNNRKKINK